MPDRPVAIGEAAAAALAALDGGAAVAVVIRTDTLSATAARMLVFADGSRRGSLGQAALDDAAVELGERVLRDGGACSITVGDAMLYAEAQRARERLIVVGAGHIGVQLARLAAGVDFDVLVLDDREEFASDDRFPAGVAVSRVDFAKDPFEGIALDRLTYLALVTRGHSWDYDCLRRLLDAPVAPRYIGMIGSRRRVPAAFAALLKSGVAREKLAAIHAPIGIEIGAETPEEIAISIMAELILVRRGARVETLTNKERVLERLLAE
jgi:xanthine dehydrogenase accessory factor